MKSPTIDEFGIRWTGYNLANEAKTPFSIKYSENSIPNPRNARDEVLVEYVLDAVMQHLTRAGMRELRRGKIGLGKYVGLEVELDWEGSTGFLRLYLAKGKVYLLMAGGKGIKIKKRDLDYYFNSFKILE